MLTLKRVDRPSEPRFGEQRSQRDLRREPSRAGDFGNGEGARVGRAPHLPGQGEAARARQDQRRRAQPQEEGQGRAGD